MTLHVRINVPPIIPALEALADGLVQLNAVLMHVASQNGIDLPDLYESGVVYRREPPGQEWWESAVDVIGIVANRSGDCEDLACYRAAELRVYEDEDAHVKIVRTRRAFHAVVLREDGSIEDPSRRCLKLEQARNRKGKL